MIDGFLIGAEQLFTSPQTVGLFFIALFGGLIFGLLPGISAATLAAIVLPFTAKMEPAEGIMVFGVLYAAGVFGGSITAILFNIPGAASNVPTAFDGYPMTQKGEAGRAIGTSIFCSALGGTASAVVLMTMTGFLATFAIRTFGPPEMFGLIFFGLSIAGTVGADTAARGLLSVGLGLLIGTVGVDPGTGTARFSFGSPSLMSGIGFVPLLLGLFAISEVLAQGQKMISGMRIPPHLSVEFPKLREIWGLKVALVRSALIGFIAGVLPGIGAALGSMVSYNEAVRWSRHPERFGHGEIEGVVASETANNAATGTALIPLLALGIPGGTVAAVMMGAFMVHGMEPGPLVILTNPDLVWLLFVAFFFANLSIFLLGYIQVKTVVHLLRVPFSILGPTILLVSMIGAYALRNSMFDVMVMFIAGGAGYFLRRSGYSMGAIVLGVVLGRLGESAFIKTAQLLQYDLTRMVERPIALTLICLAVASIILSIVRTLHRTRPATGVGRPTPGASGSTP